MPNTTNLALPYPVLSDAPNVPQHLQSLATTIDTNAQPKLAQTVLSAGAAVSLAAGWALGGEASGAKLVKIPLVPGGASLVHFQCNLSRTGAAISVGTGANITDTDICTLPAGYRPASAWGVFIQILTQPVGTGRIDAAGLIQIQEIPAGGSIPTSGTIRIATTYLVDV